MYKQLGLIAIIVVVLIFCLVIVEDYVAPVFECEQVDGRCFVARLLDSNSDNHVSLLEQLRPLAEREGE